MYRLTCTFLSPYSLYATSILRLYIWTFLYPLPCLYLHFFLFSTRTFFFLFLYPYLPLLFLCKHPPFSASVSVSSFRRSPVHSFPHSSICTFLSPPLCLPFSASVMHLCFSAPLYLPFSVSLSIYFFLCSTFSPSQKIKEIYSFCTLIPTYQTTWRHMQENNNIKVLTYQRSNKIFPGLQTYHSVQLECRPE